jgi:hypothetical protein
MNRSPRGVLVVLVVLLAAILFWLARNGRNDAGKIEPMEADRLVEASAAAYDSAKLRYEAGNLGVEELYRWSKRLLEAQLQAAQNAERAQAARQDHVQRMQQLHDSSITVSDQPVAPGDDYIFQSIRYYLAEAQITLSSASR